MEYIKREMERKFLLMDRTFKVVMLTGARQVGKTTMLQHLAADGGRTFVTMDNARDRELAESDPELFFQIYKPPVLIDEAQKAPGLFETMKVMCDRSEETGRFWLTGSEGAKLLEKAQDSLAGRIGIIRLHSLSQREKAGCADVEGFDFAFPALVERQRRFSQNDIVEVYGHIWRGGMPAVQSMNPEQMEAYYSSYIDTYLMRDAVDDNGIRDTFAFRKVLQACTAFIGNLVNYSDLAAAGGVSVATAKSWVHVLESMGIVFLLQPYSNNELKRLVKTPKLFFCDTGLAAYLAGWSNSTALMNGAAAGKFFENYVVGEFLRAFACGEKQARMYFYRDSNQKEIDLVIEQDNVLHPVEAKRAANPDRRTVKAFSVLAKANESVGNGAVACLAERPYPIDRDNSYLPCNII